MVMLSETVVQQPSVGFGAEALPSQSTLAPMDLSGALGWTRLSATESDASIFHSPNWMTALAETYHFRPVCYTASQKSSGASVQVPFFEIDGFGKTRGVSLPFTDFCDPLTNGPVQPQWFWEHLTSCARARGWGSIELRGGMGLTDEGLASATFFGHVLHLEGGAAEIWGRLHPSVRRAVRKGERAGVTVAISVEPEAVREYYRLHCQTRKRHGLPPQPFRWFQNLHQHLLSKDLGWIVLARWRGQAVAGAMILQAGRKAIFKFGASDWKYRECRANDLVMWSAIQQCLLRSCAILHFGRTSQASAGLRRFKLGWGTEELQIRYFKYDLKHSTFIKDEDRALGWHNSVFRAMPTWLARAAGALLYKRFA